MNIPPLLPPAIISLLGLGLCTFLLGRQWKAERSTRARGLLFGACGFAAVGLIWVLRNEVSKGMMMTVIGMMFAVLSKDRDGGRATPSNKG